MSQLSCSDTPTHPVPNPAQPPPDWPPGPPGLQGAATTAPSPQQGLRPHLPQVQGLGGPAARGPRRLPSSASIRDFGGEPPPFTPLSPSDVPLWPLQTGPDVPETRGRGGWRETDGEKAHFEEEALFSKRNPPTSHQASRNITARIGGESCRLGRPVLSPTCLHHRAPRCRRRLWPPLAPRSLQLFSSPLLQRCQHLQQRWAGPGAGTCELGRCPWSPRAQPGHLEEEPEERMLPAAAAVLMRLLW